MNKKYDYIKIKIDVQPNIFICEKCGDRFQLPHSPMRFSMLQAIMNTFLKDHKKCITLLPTRRQPGKGVKRGSFAVSNK